MKRIVSYWLICFGIILGNAQRESAWQGYFSYNLVKDLAYSPSSIYAGCENTIFSYNIASGTLQTLNSIDGFKPDEISAVYYSEAKQLLFVGNKNGLLLLVKNDGTVLQKRGIINEIPVSFQLKNINNFYEYQDKIYLSCDYGISSFDLNVLEFGDSYIIGNNGQYGKVFQTTVWNDEIYAVTQYEGIKKASVTNPNLVDYNQWIVFNASVWNGITTFQNNLVLTNYGSAYKYDGVNFTQIATANETINKLAAFNNFVTLTTTNKIIVLDASLLPSATITTSQLTGLTTQFTASVVFGSDVYAGTTTEGMLKIPLTNPSGFQLIKPNGPEQNNIFRLKKSTSALWAIYGKYDPNYNPYNPNPPYTPYTNPISIYNAETGWSTIPYADLLGAKSLANIAIKPTDENEVYISSYFSGLLKIKDGIPETCYDNTNTGTDGLQSLIPTPPNPTYIDIRVNGPAYDSNGNLWMTNNFVAKPLKVLKAGGTWQSFSFSETVPSLSGDNFASLVVDKNNTKWLPTQFSGLVGFNEQTGKTIQIQDDSEGNLPDTDVRCLAIDARNQLWIGTIKGLRIITNVDQFQTEESLNTRAIIILEDDLAQELFFEQQIVDICVDGANRKWVSIGESGAYLVSSNGQETLYHFTKENSPLPSNNVNDIEIDSVTGEVFFATDKGLVSFKGSATKPSDDLSNVYVYPNPVRPEYTGTVKISGLTDKANVKVTDIAGNLVYETTAQGGTIEWDTTAFGKYKVASGVYMVFVAAQDGIETKVKKVMIVR